jgi:hypothetical protein
MAKIRLLKDLTLVLRVGQELDLHGDELRYVPKYFYETLEEVTPVVEATKTTTTTTKATKTTTKDVDA